jgi:hypothetical protein
MSPDLKRKVEHRGSTPEDLASKRLRVSDTLKLCEACEKRLSEFSNVRVTDLQRQVRGAPASIPIPSFRFECLTCALCTMLRAYFARNKCTDRNQQVLHAFSFTRVSPIVRHTKGGNFWRNFDTVCLKPPNGDIQEVIFCFCKADQQFLAFSPQSIRSMVDLACCNEWIQYCKDNHGETCGRSVAFPTDIALIDCASRKVVRFASRVPYIALSYGWGSGASENASGFSQTVQDAIKVTNDLGYQYLWVDKHCINQDSSHKLQQISQTDLVYSAADITIIAAAGIDAQSGLSGISDPRNERRVLELEQYRVLDVPEIPHTAIPKSKWSTRAWTLQEAFLSRRRLVFTRDQAYFECTVMNGCESLTEDRNLTHYRNKTMMKDEHHPGIFAGRKQYSESPRAGAWHLKQNQRLSLRTLIEEYTSRKLTCEKDSNNAFMGIMKQFQSRDPSLRHIWSMPIKEDDFSRGAFYPTTNSFLWKHDRKNDEPPSRRKSFPSWAWVGWEGRIIHDDKSGYHAVDISLELDDGQRVPLSSLFDAEQAPTWESLSQPKALIWKTTFVNVRFVHAFTPSENTLQFHSEQDRRSLDVFLSIEYNHESVHGLFTSGLYRIMRTSVNAGLVVTKEGDSYVRIGVAQFLPYPKDGYDTKEEEIRLI